MAEEQIMVSVLCTAYNHEPYIRDCLDGFVNQKTDFKYEVIIHDDASTDKTADIIREYEAKYPDIIKPIYQTQNQYSQGVRIGKVFFHPRIKGKYMAWCEGDDYWCDEHKLQIQVDYMEAHPDCTLCVHQTHQLDMMTNQKKMFTKIDTDGEVPIETILEKGAIFATSSCFVRTQVNLQMPELFRAKGFGDHQLIIYNTLQGYCYYFAKPMSVYRFRSEGSWTRKNIMDCNRRIAHNRELIALMERIDQYTEGKYHKEIEKKIESTAFNYHLAHGDVLEVSKKKYKKYYSGDWKPWKEALSNKINRAKSNTKR